MKNTIILLAIGLLFTSCAINHHDNLPIEHGFWFGLWNGFTAPFSFIASLFIEGITVFDTHNNGGWYAFGFLLGIGAFSSGTTKSTSK